MGTALLFAIALAPEMGLLSLTAGAARGSTERSCQSAASGCRSGCHPPLCSGVGAMPAGSMPAQNVSIWRLIISATGRPHEYRTAYLSASGRGGK